MPFNSEGVEAGVGLALSGGGFRATLFHTGVLWRLNELGALSKLDRVSSVSGGSITAAVLAKAWPSLGFQDGVATSFRGSVVAPILDFTQRNIDKPSILKGIFTPGKSIAEFVTAQYRKHLFGDLTLQSLPDRPRFVINATNLGTGANWRFSKPYCGDYRIGLIRNPDIPLATAVAASAAFPPVLSPVVLDLDPARFERTEGADLFDQVKLRTTVSLADGGVYDNMALETIWKRLSTLIVSDAGGPASMEFGPKPLWWNQLHRAYGLTIEQDRDLRRRILYEALKGPIQSGTYWHITWPVARFGAPGALPVKPEWPRAFGEIRTRLNPFSDDEQKHIINWGYAIADAGLRGELKMTGPIPSWPFLSHALA